MIYSQETWAYIVAWIANITFFIGFIPQIILNYRLKTTRGLSNVYILSSLNSHFACLYYAFCMNLPLVHKIMVPLFTMAVLTIVFQRFYYSSFRKRNLFIYLLNILFVISLLPLVLKQPKFMGVIFGWIAIFIGFWQKVPQIRKIHVEKSVKGFSLFFVLICITGYLFEISASIILKLPFELIFNDFRSLMFYTILGVQYFLYKNPRLNKNKGCTTDA